VSSSLTKTFFR